MAENEEDLPEEFDEEFEDSSSEEDVGDVVKVSGMYEDWFLDYASYVILERAVPHVNDGLKPVQRRILHSLREMDDGRFHKVANVIGNTMKYHPHGDASIGDAMVQIGQRDLLLDTQGNWGNIFTGDRAAAPRYIEVRLSKFALDVVFNPKTTEWQASYDGRGKEPVTLPSKFPLLLAQGVEGIAVGLACKLLPHNFVELIDNSINYLKGKRIKIYPDFPTGGMIDVSNYNDGLRGGRVRVRAKISQEDKKTLKIEDIPFGTTTSSLIDSILKANDKGKIKIKKIEDNTAEKVEILIHLKPDVSPDRTIDALYAFTDCEVSISPNSVVIDEDKPQFLGVTEILKRNTDQTVELLKRELEIEKGELLDKLHFASLEKIFIENKIYIEFDGKTYEEAIEVTFKLLAPHVKDFVREVTREDVERLLEIRMRRITKHDSDKADELINNLNEKVKEVEYHLDNLIKFAIDYYQKLKDKYGKGRERKTEIKSFEVIEKSKVVVANEKLYANLKEGFVGIKLKRTEGEYITDCSDIDDIITIRRDGVLQVSKVSEKAFFGKDLIHVGIWKKGDTRTIYNMIYQDGPRGNAYVKRFAVKSITRDREYDLTAGTKGSKVLYLTVNPNGEAEVVKVVLRQKPKVKKLKFDFDFADQIIRGRNAKGNILTKHAVLKIELKEEGVSTLGARKIWFDETVQRLNTEERGFLVGEFMGDDKIVTIMQSGHYKLSPYALATKFDDDFLIMEKYDPEKVYSMIYFDGDKEQYNVKRFTLEPTDKKTLLITEHHDSFLEVVSGHPEPEVIISFDKRSSKKDDERIKLDEFIAVKGMKAQGNKLTSDQIKSIELIEPELETDAEDKEEEEPIDKESDDFPEEKQKPIENAKADSPEEVEDKPSEKKISSQSKKDQEKEIDKAKEEKKPEAKKEPQSGNSKQEVKKPAASTKKEKLPPAKSEDKPEKTDSSDEGPMEIELDVEKSEKKEGEKKRKPRSRKDDDKGKEPPSNQITLEL